MTYVPEAWTDLPLELQPADNELRSAWLARVALWEVDHPGVLTPIDAAALNDWEDRIGTAVADEQLAREAADDAITLQLADKQDAADAVTDGELNAAVDLLEAADDVLTAAVVTEAGTRAADDADLTAALGVETAARIDGDADSLAAVAVETAAREGAVSALTTIINTKQNAATAATDAELAAAVGVLEAADDVLTTALTFKADLVGGIIPTSQIPATALVTVTPVADRPAMLALTAEPGDVAVVAADVDTKRHTYMLQASPASTYANWVEVDGPVAPVSSVNGQIGIVVLGPSDVGAATPSDVAAAVAAEAGLRTTADVDEENARIAADDLRALINSPTFTGTPAAPTPSQGDNSTRLATTAYADTAVTNSSAALDALIADEAQARADADVLKAPLASPAFTGTPTAPTATPGNNSTRVATTAYTDAAVGVETSARNVSEALLAPLASPAFTGNPTAPNQTQGDNSTRLATTRYTDVAVGAEASDRAAAEALLAPKASPTLTGVPVAPTAAQGTNTTQLATTEYVQTEAGLLVPYSLINASGDLLVGTANDTIARKAVGTNRQVLTADSGSTGGMKWADVQEYGGSDWLTSGALTENLPRHSSEISASFTPPTGTMRLFPGARLKAGVQYSSITFVNGGTTAGATLTHSWAVLADKSNRTIVAVSADNTGASWALNTARTFTFSAAYTPSSDKTVYFGLVVAYPAGTAPVLLGVSGGNALVGTSAGLTQISGTSTTALTTPVANGTVLASLAGGTVAANTSIAYAYLS